MIISRTNNFIFIRTAKVASASIEYALSLHCLHAQDVITPIDPFEEVKRYRLGIVPKNYAANREVEIEYEKLIATGNVDLLKDAKRKLTSANMIFWNHISAKEIRQRVGESFWQKAYKFSVVRHPYEYVTSLVYHRLSDRGASHSALQKWSEFGRVLLRSKRNLDIICIDGEIAVDRVLRYETLTDDLRDLAREIGLDISGALPRAKGNMRPLHATAESELGPLSRWLIHQKWKREFELFYNH